MSADRLECVRLALREFDCGKRKSARCDLRQASHEGGGFAYCWCRNLAEGVIDRLERDGHMQPQETAPCDGVSGR